MPEENLHSARNLALNLLRSKAPKRKRKEEIEREPTQKPMVKDLASRAARKIKHSYGGY